LFKKRRINHSRGTVNIHVKSDGTVIYENVIDLTELDKKAEEEEKGLKENLSDTERENANDELKNEESILEQEMEKREEILKILNEEALREKYPLMPEKRSFSEPNTEEVIAAAKKVTEDLDWLRQELTKMDLERKLEGTSDPYRERDRRILERKRRETKPKMVNLRKFFCKIGIHKWSRKTYIDYGPTSNVKTWRRYCKVCGKTQSWVQAKGDKERFRGKR